MTVKVTIIYWSYDVGVIALMKKINHFTDVISFGPKFISEFFVIKYLLFVSGGMGTCF